MNWQPIETAPTDATLVLVAVDEGNYFELYTAFSGGHEWQDGYDGAIISTGKVLFWMPLPEKPTI